MAERDRADPILEIAEKWEQHGWHGGPRLIASLAILRADSRIRDESGRLLRRFNLTYPRHELLTLLFFTRRGELPMGKIGKLLMLHPTSITSTVSGLEKLGYVERVPHPTDGRAVLARITEAGAEAVRRSTPELLSYQFGLGTLDEEESMQLFNLLRKACL